MVAIKCIYLWTTRVRPPVPKIDFLVAGWGWGAWTAYNNRDGGWGWGWWQVKYCCGYEINTWSYTVTVGAWWAACSWWGTSTFNWVSSVWGCGWTAGYYCSYDTYPYHSWCWGASGSWCAWGTCAGTKCSNRCVSWGWGWGQSGAGATACNCRNCSAWWAWISLNFTWTTVAYGQWWQSWPYPSVLPTCSQWWAWCSTCLLWGWGIVIIKYPSSCWYNITWGTKTSATISGVTYCIHCFTSNGTLTVS